MRNKTATCVVNGKLCRISESDTVSELRKKAGIEPRESIVKVSHKSAELCEDADSAVDGGKYRSIPPTTQG